MVLVSVDGKLRGKEAREAYEKFVRKEQGEMIMNCKQKPDGTVLDPNGKVVPIPCVEDALVDLEDTPQSELST